MVAGGRMTVLNDSLDSDGSVILFDSQGVLAATLIHPPKAPDRCMERPLTPALQGAHLQFLHLYRDFHGLASPGSSVAHLQALIERCKTIRSTARDVKVVLANMRRIGTAYLLMGQPARALDIAQQIVRLQFNWPYGHVLQADALLAMDRLVAASSAYQLALHLMVGDAAREDIGRTEVLQLCQDVVELIALQSCRTLTLAHDGEVTAVAAWPPPVPGWAASLQRPHSRGDTISTSFMRGGGSAVDLQVHVDNAVNSALEVFSQTGAVASGFQLSGSAGPSTAAPSRSGSSRLREFTPPSPPERSSLPHSEPLPAPGGSSGALPPLGTPPLATSAPLASKSVLAARLADSLRSRADTRGAGGMGLGKTLDNLLSDEMARACRDPALGGDGSQAQEMSKAEFDSLFNTVASSVGAGSHDTSLTSRSAEAIAAIAATAQLDSHDRPLDLSGASGGRPSIPRHDAAVSRSSTRADEDLDWKFAAAYMAAGLLSSVPARSLTSTLDYDNPDSPFMSTEGDARRGSAVVRRYLATASTDGCVKVWDLDEMACVNVLQGHEEGVILVTWAASCRNDILLIASASTDGVVVIWVLSMEAALLEQRTLLGHRSHVTNMSFTPNRSKLITAGVDGTICIWRVATGKLIGKLNGHERGITSLATLPINGALAVVSSDTSGKWCLWDFQSRECVVTAKARHGCTLCTFTPRIPTLTPPRPLLLTCHWSQSKQQAFVNLWDVFSKSASGSGLAQPVHVFEVGNGRIADISVTFDTNNHALLATGCMDGSLTMMDLGCRTVLSQIRDAHIDAEGCVMPILQVQFSLDGRLLFTSGADCSIKVWSRADMEVMLTFRGHSSPVTCLCSTDSGTALASASEAGELAVWGLELVEELASSALPGFRV